MTAQPTKRANPVRVSVLPALRAVTIDWGVSRRAMKELAPNGNAPLLTLRYHASPDASESWSIHDPVSHESFELPRMDESLAGIPEIRVSAGYIHIRSAMLYAFVSLEADQPELLYARTNIFEQLGIAGGRYQPLGVQVEPQH